MLVSPSSFCLLNVCRKVLSIDSTMRLETEGTPVPVRQHNTQQNLIRFRLMLTLLSVTAPQTKTLLLLPKFVLGITCIVVF